MVMAESSPPPVLFINLDRATERRRNIEEGIQKHLPNSAVHRLAAVDGQAQSDNQMLALTPYTRFLLANRQKASAHAQIESWGAVGCTLSHVQCWEWLLAQPYYVRDMLILEDDACFGPQFTSTWNTVIRALRLPRFPEWDVVMLGYYELHGQDVAIVHEQRLKTLKPGGGFFGTHAYLVTRRGAAILRQNAFPLEIQTDAYMITLQQLGSLRLFLVDGEEVMSQCLGGTEQGISHEFTPPSILSAQKMQELVHGFPIWMWLVLLILAFSACFFLPFLLYRCHRRHGRAVMAATTTP